MKPRAIVVTGFGINCDLETEEAFRRAGADARRVHLNDLIANPRIMEESHIFAIPGGFAFGDDVASGKILANRMRYKLGTAFIKFVNDGKLIIGICNGFQVMVKMGLLPLFSPEFTQEVTLTHNDSDRFENRWVNLTVSTRTHCIWLKNIHTFEAPIRHGEGKLVVRDAAVLERLHENNQIALRYAADDGAPAARVFPANPNGSVDDIAGICDPSGRIFGLMPHPEACLDPTNHPLWTRRGIGKDGEGLEIFRNGVLYAEQNLVSKTETAGVH